MRGQVSYSAHRVEYSSSYPSTQIGPPATTWRPSPTHLPSLLARAGGATRCSAPRGPSPTATATPSTAAAATCAPRPARASSSEQQTTVSGPGPGAQSTRSAPQTASLPDLRPPPAPAQARASTPATPTPTSAGAATTAGPRTSTSGEPSSAGDPFVRVAFLRSLGAGSLAAPLTRLPLPLPPNPQHLGV